MSASNSGKKWLTKPLSLIHLLIWVWGSIAAVSAANKEVIKLIVKPEVAQVQSTGNLALVVLLEITVTVAFVHQCFVYHDLHNIEERAPAGSTWVNTFFERTLRLLMVVAMFVILKISLIPDYIKLIPVACLVLFSLQIIWLLMDIIYSPSFQFSKTVAQIPKLFTSSGSATSERVHWARSDLLAAFHWALLVWITFWPPPTGNWLTAMVVALLLTSGIYLAVLWLRLFREAEEKWSDYGRFATAILLSLIVVAIGRTLPAFVDIATWIQQVVLALCRLHVDFRREDWIQLAAAVAMGAIALFYKFRTETSADCVTKK